MKYWPAYCEENVWHACAGLPAGADGAWAVFISNAAREVAVWQQRDAPAPDQPMVWDYHVILVSVIGGEPFVIDADSTLATPTPAGEYFARCFPALPEPLAIHRPRFRVVEAGEYREKLRSDRSHMRDQAGVWRSPPPPWPFIGEGTNLMEFVDTESAFFGETRDLDGMRAWIAALRA